MATSGAGLPPDPNVANPEADQAVPAEPSGQDPEWYRQQYEQLRPEYTRTTQERSQLQDRVSQYESLFEALQDPEQAQEILAELGYEMDAGEEPGTGEVPDPDEWADPLEAKVAELEQLAEAFQAERDQEAQSAQEQELLDLRDEYIDDAIAYINSQPSTPDLTEDEQEILGNLAIAMVDEEGVPDVVSAYNRLYGEGGVLETNRSRWISTKHGALPAPLGHAGSSEKRPTNRKERVAYLDSRMRSLDEQQ
ncbi:MAG: hypothetical protein ACREBC_25445 [Pyrinomonadaceae bacterium]